MVQKRGLIWKGGEKKHSHPHKIFTYMITTALDTWLEIYRGHLTDDVTACLLCPRPPSFPHQQHGAHKLTSAAQKDTFICHALQPSIMTEIATETRESSGPVHCHRAKKKEKAVRKRGDGKFFLCDQFSLSCISLQKFPLPGERHTVHWHMNRKQILVVQGAGSLFDLLRILSCKILNIYALQLKYPCSSSDSQEKRPRAFQFPIRLIT